MKSRLVFLSVAVAALSACADELVWPTYPPRNGQTYYVGDYEYVLVSPETWAYLTNTVERLKDLTAQRWMKEHETVAGRAMWHGAATNRVVTAEGVSWLYRDGYVYFERAAPTRRVAPSARRATRPENGPSVAPRPLSTASLPPRLEVDLP